MALEEIIIRCLDCGTKNRIPKERKNDRPRCGRCGALLVNIGAQVSPIKENKSDSSYFLDAQKLWDNSIEGMGW